MGTCGMEWLKERSRRKATRQVFICPTSLSLVNYSLIIDAIRIQESVAHKPGQAEAWLLASLKVGDPWRKLSNPWQQLGNLCRFTGSVAHGVQVGSPEVRQ